MTTRRRARAPRHAGIRTLRILDVPDVEEWARYKDLPRAVQPLDFALEPCPRCTAPCCAAIVRLTTVEALRIAFTLHLELATFLEPMAFDPDHPCLGNARPFRLDDGQYQLRLQQRSGWCVGVFTPALGRVRCGMHAVRPGACRVYPHTVAFTTDSDEDGEGEHRVNVGSQRLCAVRWLQDEGTRARMRQDLEQWQKDLDEDAAITARWNRGKRKDRSWAGFLAWLHTDVAPTLGYDVSKLEPLPRRKLRPRLW